MVSLVTIIAFDLGMIGWMLILYYTENMPAAADVRFTFLMQVGLILGTLTVYPAMRYFAARKQAAAPPRPSARGADDRGVPTRSRRRWIAGGADDAVARADQDRLKLRAHASLARIPRVRARDGRR